MTRFHFERPDGPPSNNAQNILVHLNEFVPPQGFDVGGASQVELMAYEPDNWLSGQYQLRTPFTINGGEVPTTLTDFPVKIEATFPELIGKSKDELAFASIDNIQLKHEIDEFDTITGKFIAWIKKSSVSDGDIIYAYYDNPVAVNTEDKNAVWSNNFVVVQHMNELSGDIIDSTINANDMTEVGLPLNVTGAIGNAKNLLTSADRYIISANDSLNTSDITISAWVNAASYTGLMAISAKASFPDDTDWLFIALFGILLISISNNPSIQVGLLSNGVTQHVAFVITGTTTLNVYIDGALIHTQTIIAKNTSSDSSLELGSAGGANGFQGIMDEFHMSNDGKSSDWIKTEYNNQRPTGNTFFTVGAEESIPALDTMAYEPNNWLNPQWQQRIPKTINAGQVPTTLTDFPLLINDTFTELIGASEIQLRFASTDNIQLEYDIEKFDNVTGELVVWIKKPTVNDGDVIYIYFDNSFPGVVDEQNSAAVFSNNFVMVQHMNETSGNIILDSTGNNNDMTEVGSPINALTDIIDGTKNFPTSNDGYIIPANPSLNTSDITVSVWIKADGPSFGEVIAAKVVNSTDLDWNLQRVPQGGNDIFRISLDNNPLIGMLVTLFPGVLYHIAFVITGTTTLNVYIDGALIHTQTINPKQTSSTSELQFSGIVSGFPGDFDEFHMSNDGKSSDWIKTEYNNQRPTGNVFYTTGAVEAVPTTFDRMAYEVTP